MSLDCPSCQGQNLDTDRFCPNCGRSLVASAVPEAAAPVTPTSGPSPTAPPTFVTPPGTTTAPPPPVVPPGPAAPASSGVPPSTRRLPLGLLIGGVVAVLLLVAGTGAALALMLGGDDDDPPRLPSPGLATTATPAPDSTPTTGTPAPDSTPGSASPAPTPVPATPTPGNLDSSFCAPVETSQWTPSSLLGKSFDVREVLIPNTSVELFPGGRVMVVNQLGDAGGYGAFADADAVARDSYTEFDAAKLRYLVVDYGDRYYVFEGREHAISIEPDLNAPAPCRVPPSDGALVAWRAIRYVTDATLNYGGLVSYWWTVDGEDMCATENIRLAYPALRQCTDAN